MWIPAKIRTGAGSFQSLQGEKHSPGLCCNPKPRRHSEGVHATCHGSGVPGAQQMVHQNLFAPSMHTVCCALAEPASGQLGGRLSACLVLATLGHARDKGDDTFPGRLFQGKASGVMW